MNKRLIFTTFFILFSCLAVFGQKNKLPDFDTADFIKKQEVAEWLCKYDAIAWCTSDSVAKSDPVELQKLGGEWFCFEAADKNWHAVYGKYEDNRMNVVFHYLVDASNKVSRINQDIDADFLNTHARALMLANKQIAAMRDSVKLRFNQYIKLNEDKTFTVWIFPAFQPNSVAVYGGEFVYKIDKTGTEILEDNSYFQGHFRGFQVGTPREVWLGYTELDNPTIGTVFFVWYYKQYFTNIMLDNKYYTTTAFKTGDGKYTWIHKEKNEKQKKGKTKAKREKSKK